MITLQFADMYLLWKFAKKLTCKTIEIKTRTKILICECSAYEIDLAVRHYSAKTLEMA